MPLKAWKNPVRSKCCVQGCSTRICSGISMHGFPRMDRHPDLYQHWVDAIRLANKTPFWNPRKSTKVCAFHFETVENCRIRVPTVFPNIDSQVASTSENTNYQEYNDDDDFTGQNDEEDPIDRYEDGIAANNSMDEDPSSVPYYETGNTDSSFAYEAIIEEDSAMAYNEIEEKYNNIVGDVVSTLTCKDVVNNKTNVYNEVEEGESAMSYNDEVDEEGAAHCSIEEEILYDGVYTDGDIPIIQTQVSPEKIGLNQEDLGDTEYCVVVVRRLSDETVPENTNSLISRKSLSTGNLATKKSPGKKSKRRGHFRNTSKNMVNVKAAKPLPSSIKPILVGTLSAESADVPEEVKLPSEGDPENPGQTESDSTIVRREDQDALSEEQQILPSEQTKMQQDVVVSPTKKSDDKPKERKTPTEKSPAEQKELETPAKRSPVKQEEPKASPCEDQGKDITSGSVSAKRNQDGVKIDELIIDGEPIKLKKCSVSIVKTPTKSASKQKVTSLSNNNRSSTIKPKDKNPDLNDDAIPSHGGEGDSGYGDKMAPEGSSKHLEALSLKGSQEEGNAGLRRSARIRAGGGKRRKFGTRSSWSVAFRDPPKKKLKVEIDEGSQSSESVPYDFEDECDPDVDMSDLEGIDTEDTFSEGESDVSVKRVKNPPRESNCLRAKPQPKSISLAAQKQGKGRATSAATEGNNRAKFHGYHRVRLGDQATQVGLPGSCDGFVFDVIRDDPRNVGVSCNIFYDYQPKKYRASAWARFRDSLGSPSATPTVNGVRPGTSVERTRKRGPINESGLKAVESYDISDESQDTSRISVQGENLERNERAIDVENTEESVSIIEDIYIKVEPGMEALPGSETEASGSVQNAGVGRKTQKIIDIHSLAEAPLAELEVKEEEEWKEKEDAQSVRNHQQSTVPTDLCAVSHDVSTTENIRVEHRAVNEDGDTNFSSIPVTQPGKVSGHSDEAVTKTKDADDTVQLDSAEQSCVEEAVERETGIRARNIGADGETLQEPMAISDAILHNKANPDAECLSGTAASLTGTDELPVPRGKSETSTEHSDERNAPIDEDLDSAAGPLLETLKDLNAQSADLPGDSRPTEVADVPLSLENNGNTGKDQNHGLAVINSAMIKVHEMIVSTKSAESLSEAGMICLDASAKSHDQAEMLELGKQTFKESAESAGALTDLALPDDAPVEAEMSCPPQGAENIEGPSHPDGVQASDDRIDVVAGWAKVSVSFCAEKPSDVMDADKLDTLDAECIPAHHESQDEIRDEQPCFPEFSSDSDSDSLIKVPVPAFSSNSDVRASEAIPTDFIVSNKKPQSVGHKETTGKHNQSEIDADDSPSDAGAAEESNLQTSSADSSESPEDSEETREVPVVNLTFSPSVANENIPSEGNLCQNQSDDSQDVFDSVERKLEKMFDMDT